MFPIPLKIRHELEGLDRMKRCARCGAQPVEWHHALIYRRRQVQEVFAIVALCHSHHVGKGKDDAHARYIALSQATQEDLNKYPKANWEQELNYLKTIYGNKNKN